LKVNILKSRTTLVKDLASLWSVHVGVEAHVWSEWLHEPAIFGGASTWRLGLQKLVGRALLKRSVVLGSVRWLLRPGRWWHRRAGVAASCVNASS